MESIKSTRHARIGRPVVYLNPQTILSNLVTLIVSSNHHPTSLREISPDVMEEWFTTAVTYVALGQDRNVVANMFSREKANADNFKTPMREYLMKYSRVVASLLFTPEYRPDAGLELKQALLATGDWEVKYVTSPSLGYPREYMHFKYAIGEGMPLFGTSTGNIEGIRWLQTGGKGESTSPVTSTERVQRALARTLFIFDRVAMDDSRVPEAKGQSTRDAREAFMGSAQAALSQQLHLTSIPILYLFQYAALWPRLTEKLEAHAADLARALYPRDVAALTTRNELKRQVLDRIPLHPLLHVLSSVFRSPLLMETEFGDHDALQLPSETPLPQDPTSANRESTLAQLYLTAALSDQFRLASLANSSAPTVSWVDTLIRSVAPNLSLATIKRHAAISAGGGYANLIETLALWTPYVSLFPEQSRRLGWHSGVDLHLTNVSALGCDFILTDGDNYSGSPIMVLTGLTPSLPISNPKVSGFALRFQSDFNTGPQLAALSKGDNPGRASIKWSTLTTRPFISMLDGDRALAQYYMPAGMLMGETGGEMRYAGPELEDKIGRRMVAYYKRKSEKGFVGVYAGAPADKQSRVAQNLVRLYTDWETTVESSNDPDAIQVELLAAYGPNKVDEQADLYAYRDAWKERIPVAMSRDNKYYWMDELGTIVQSYDFEGYVMFNDRIDLPHDTGSIDGLPELLLMTQPPKLPDAVDQPAVPPTPAAGA